MCKFFSKNYGQGWLACYHHRRWPLLCSGPADSQPVRAAGFFVVPPFAFQRRERCTMWQIDGLQASLNARVLSASVLLQQPQRGLGDVMWLRRSLAGARLLQVQSSNSGGDLRLVDSYVRGADLVASHEVASGRSLATQIYWRYVEHLDLGAAGFELMVSVRTKLLDADPQLTFGSVLSCTELIQAVAPDAAVFQPVPVPSPRCGQSVRRAGVGLFVHRLTDDAVSYVEMVHPADFSAVEFAVGEGAAGCVQSRFRLFEERLEKGVLRRARARGLLCRREDDEAVARECYRRLLASESPLTT